MIEEFKRVLPQKHDAIGELVWFINKCEIDSGYVQDITYCRDYVKVSIWTKNIGGLPLASNVLITNVYDCKEDLIEMLLEEL